MTGPNSSHPSRLSINSARTSAAKYRSSANAMSSAASSLASIPAVNFPHPIDTAEVPTSIAVADFNGDGKLDWAISSGGGTIWLYLGNGDGSWQTPRALFTGGKYPENFYEMSGNPSYALVPLAVAAGQLRKNGPMDLVVGESTGNFGALAVMLNNGDGTFQTARRIAMQCVPTNFAIADLDGDGNMDILAGCLDNGTPRFFKGDGAGNFDSEKFAIINSLGNMDQEDAISGLITNFGLGDYNGDGIPDLAIAAEGGGFVAMGLGNGQFSKVQELLHQTTCLLTCATYATAAKFVDADGDGQLDVVVSDSYGNASVFRNHGDGTFETGKSIALGGSAGDLIVVDVNGDGHPDLVSGGLPNPIYPQVPWGAQTNNALSVNYGDGKGGFSAPVLFNGGDGMVALAAADINGDGRVDVISVDQWAGTFTQFVNDGKGGFGTPSGGSVSESDGNALLSAAIVADVDGDGKKDVAFLESFGATAPYRIKVALADGTGRYGAPVTTQLVDKNVSDLLTHFALEDFRNIGRSELIFATGLAVNFFPSIGGGSFGSPLTVASGFATTALATGDLNGDHHLDFVALTYNTYKVFVGNGDGTFTNTANIPVNSNPLSNPSASQMFIADINHDGKQDIVTHFDLQSVDVLFGNGDGTFQNPKQIFTQINAFTLADVNKDGIPDVIVGPDGYPGTGSGVTVYLGKGDGTFQAGVTYAPFLGDGWFNPKGGQNGPGVFGPPVGDFDGDGNLDIVVLQRYVDDGFFQLLRGNGDGTFTPVYRFYPIYNMGAPTVADRYGSGRAELVLSNTLSQSFQFYSGFASLPGIQLFPSNTSDLLSDGYFSTSLDLASASGQSVAISAPTGTGIPPLVSIAANGNATKTSFTVGSSYDPAEVFPIVGSIGGQSSSTIGNKQFNPIPRLGVLFTDVIIQGQAPFTATVTGAGLLPTTTATVDGVARDIVINGSQVQFGITATDLAVVGTHSIVLHNGAPGGGDSNQAWFYVNADALNVQSTYPTNAVAGNAGFTLQVRGGFFTSNTVIRWDGVDRPTTFVSIWEVDITLTAADLATAATHQISAHDPKNGGMTSAALGFTVYPSIPPRGFLESWGSDYNGSTTFGNFAPVTFKGWAGDDLDPAHIMVFLRIDGGSNFAVAPANQPRPDVATTLGDPNLANSGYELHTCCIAPGTHTVKMFAKDMTTGLESELTNISGSNTFTVPAINPEALGKIEKISGNANTSVLIQNGMLFLSGWATFPSTTLGEVRIFLDDVFHPIGKATIGYSRPDIAGKYSYVPLHVGFAYEMPLGNITPGYHTLVVGAFDTLGSQTQLDGSGTLEAQAGSIVPTSVALSPQSLDFGTAQVGQSAQKSLTITNTGSGPLSVFGVFAKADFQVTGSNCPSVLTASQSCTVTVSFVPSAVGARTGSVEAWTNASATPAAISLTGSGKNVALGYSQSSLSFGNQLVGSSVTQSVQLMNTGSEDVTINSITATGSFAQSNGCGSVLTVGGSCLVNVTFTPGVEGSQSGSLVVTSSALNSPTSLPLSGIGYQVSLGAASGSSSSQTVKAGGSATYQFAMSSNGIPSGTYQLSVSGLPSLTSYTFTPSSISLANGSASFTLVIATTAPHASLVPLQKPFAKLLVFAVFVFGMAFAAPKRNPKLLLSVIGVVAVLGMMSCGGGGGGSAATPPPATSQPGTPAGTYQVIVTASNGTASRTSTVSLTVQ